MYVCTCIHTCVSDCINLHNFMFVFMYLIIRTYVYTYIHRMGSNGQRVDLFYHFYNLSDTKKFWVVHLAEPNVAPRVCDLCKIATCCHKMSEQIEIWRPKKLLQAHICSATIDSLFLTLCTYIIIVCLFF